MKILDRYVGSIFLRFLLIIVSFLGFLFSFFEFIVQLDDVGKGQYHSTDALLFVILTLPGRMVDLLPESSLRAGHIALGILADNNELLAMHSSGFSPRRICAGLAASVILLMAAAAFIVQFIAPPLDQQARRHRLSALGETEMTMSGGGFWARNGQFFIHVRESKEGMPADVDIFELDSDGRLRMFTHAAKGNAVGVDRWTMTDVEQKTFTDDGIITKKLPGLTLASFLSAEQMAIQDVPPETLSPAELYSSIRLVRMRGENPDRYELAFWRKLTGIVAVGVFAMLAASLVFGPVQETTTGFRILIGSIVGIVLHFLNQIVGSLGLLAGLNLAFTAITPVAAILCLSLWFLWRIP